MPEHTATESRPTHPALSSLYLWLATTLVVVHPLLDVLTRSPDDFPAQHLVDPQVPYRLLEPQ